MTNNIFGVGVVLWFAAFLFADNIASNGKSNLGEVLFKENFSHGLTQWWVEGGERVWVQDGRLHIKAEGQGAMGVCTVWCRREFPGNIQVEFDAHVVSSPIEANNINFFLCYSDPSGKPLYDTRAERQTAAYKLYHSLNGYIFTFLNDRTGAGGRYPDGGTKARFRMRRCPGFKLITETYAYHCRRGRTYHVTIRKRGGLLTYAVDGKIYLRAVDPKPHKGGLIGLRTFRTHLWWDNIVVRKLEP